MPAARPTYRRGGIGAGCAGPATAHGILFMTLEDETGIANLIVRPAIYESLPPCHPSQRRRRRWGKVERQGQVVHVVVDRAADMAARKNSVSAVRPAVREFR